jgi:hypothetical protein
MKYVNYKVSNGKENNIRNWTELSGTDSQPVKQEAMNEQQTIESRLWDYIDGLSNPEEKTAIEQLIDEHIEWRNKYKELLEVQQLMSSSELDMPSLRFTRNVMEEIALHHVAPATKSYINKKIIWGIGIFFLVMIAGFLVYGFSQVNWSAGTDSSLMQDELNKVNKIDWGKFFNNTYTNIFMMINVVLGLILFDMFLQRKRQAREE